MPCNDDHDDHDHDHGGDHDHRDHGDDDVEGRQVQVMEGVVEIRSFAWIVEDYPLLLACSFKLRLPRHLICNAPCLQILKIIHNSAQVINTPFRGIRLWGNKNRLKRSPMFAAQYWVAYKKSISCPHKITQIGTIVLFFGIGQIVGKSLTLLPILTQLRFSDPSGSLTRAN